VGWLKLKTGSLDLPFDDLALGILIAAGLAYWLPGGNAKCRMKNAE
jgi:hypothetical protein